MHLALAKIENRMKISSTGTEKTRHYLNSVQQKTPEDGEKKRKSEVSCRNQMSK